MRETTPLTPEEEEARWWAEWFERDYSWEGLGRVCLGHPPISSIYPKSWRGWVVVKENGKRFCRPQGDAPKHALPASLQDYWRADPDDNWRLRNKDELRKAGELTEINGEEWHIAHLPDRLPDGTRQGWKADEHHENWDTLDAVLGSRLAVVTTETSFNTFGSPEDSDCRAQLDGAVLGRALPKLEDASSPLHVSAQRSAHLYGVYYKNRVFGPGASFDHARFAGNAWFDNAIFTGDARFDNASFAGYVSFLGASFAGNAWFNNASFADNTRFDGVVFKNSVKFTGACFSKEIRFGGSSYEDGPYTAFSSFLGRADFRDAVFEKSVHFIGTRFHGKTRFTRAQFKAPADFNGLAFSGPEINWRGAFDTARFEDFLDFRDSQYRLIAMFDGARIEGGIAYPKPGETDALRIFDKEVIAPVRSGDPEARDEAFKAVEDGARALKHQMRLQADHMREQRFYRFELIARRLQSTTRWSERLSSYAFEALADYGLSFARPLAALLVTALLFAAIYFLAAAVLTDMSLDTMTVQWGAPIHPAVAHALELALTNMLGPLRYWGSDFQPYEGQGGTGFRLVIGGLGLLHQLLSLILIFLAALALRRRFQIA